MLLVPLLSMLTPAALCTTMAPDSVYVVVSTAQDTYRQGQPVDVSLVVENRAPSPATITFASGQRYDILVVDAAGDTLYRWSADKAFIQMLGEEQIGPGEDLEFLETIERPLEPGRYVLVGILTSSSHPREARTAFTVR